MCCVRSCWLPPLLGMAGDPRTRSGVPGGGAEPLMHEVGRWPLVVFLFPVALHQLLWSGFMPSSVRWQLLPADWVQGPVERDLACAASSVRRKMVQCSGSG